jgi:hypothetical protein
MVKRRKIYIALALILAVFLTYRGYERCLSQNPTPREDEKIPPENWKEYESLVKIWPRLKQEKIESIRFCEAISLEYGYDLETDFQQNVNAFGFRERAADVVRWWPSDYKVPKENLPECIEIIDKVIKDAQRIRYRVSSLEKMLIVTSKGNYIVHINTDISKVAGPKVYGLEWMSHELGEFIVKYCIPSDERWYFVPPEEQTVAILIFSERKYDPMKGLSAHDSQIAWPPIALFGDKKLAEKLMGRSFEPKMIFEGRAWLEKIVDAYEIALKQAKELHYRRKDIYTLKGWIVFLTQDEFYWKGIGIDENSVFEDYIIESKQLKAYFDGLGLTKELLAGK